MLIGYRRNTRKDGSVKGLFDGGYKGVWYDFSDPTSMWSDTAGTVITPGGSISTLLDKSGNGYNFSQGSAQPTWNEAGYAAFNGSSQYLQMSVASPASIIDWAPGGVLNNYWTFLAVISAPSVAVGTYLWSMGNSAGGNDAHAIGSNSATATSSAAFIRNSSGGGLTNGVPHRTNFFSATKQFVGYSFHGTNIETIGTNQISTYIEDIKTIHNGGAYGVGTFTLNRFTLGALGRSGPPTNFMAVNIYQFLLINRALSISDIIKVKTRWNDLTGP